MMTATIDHAGQDYERMCNRTEKSHAIASQAHTLYANMRANNRSMVPWRNASAAVKREFVREAEQMLGYQ